MTMKSSHLAVMRSLQVLKLLIKTGRGAAAAEFAVILALLIVPLLNATDFGLYVYQRMQLQNAAQVAVQAAWVACSEPSNVPATVGTNCPGLLPSVTTAASSTSLGAKVTVSALAEGYYCISGSALVPVGTFPDSKPANCGAVGSATDSPGDYIILTASYPYTPFFGAISLASLLTSPITQTAWMRLR